MGGAALQVARVKREAEQQGSIAANGEEEEGNSVDDATTDPNVNTSVCPFMEIREGGLRAMVASCSFTAQDCVFDLGCGTGNILQKILESFPCSGVGVELNPTLARTAELNLQRYGARAKVVVDDVRNVDLHAATAVVSYFLPHSFHFLKVHLSKSLRPGCIVLNYTYPIPGWRTSHPTTNGVHRYVIGQHLPDDVLTIETE